MRKLFISILLLTLLDIAKGQNNNNVPPSSPEEIGFYDPSISLGSKGRQVNRQGVPLPNPGPTGEGESDHKPDKAYIDTFNLAPSYSVTDVSVPVQGDELKLEFRRSTGIKSYSYTSWIPPADRALGYGWDTSLGTRITVEAVGGYYQATVVDDLGNTYQYRYVPNQGWIPDVWNNMNCDSIRCRLYFGGTPNPEYEAVGIIFYGRPLIFQRTFGTTLTFEPVTSGSGVYIGKIYHRLVRVEDRNGNVLEYVYAGANQTLAIEIHEGEEGQPGGGSTHRKYLTEKAPIPVR